MTPTVVVAGVRASGDGYPNAANTIRIVRERNVAEVVDVGVSLSPDMHLWRLRSMPVWRRAKALFFIAGHTVLSFGRALAVLRRKDVVIFVPYPAAPFLLLVSLLPRALRPRCIADAYISIWDSAFNDRSRGRPPSRLASLARRIEARALRAASVVIVDTAANRKFMVAQLGLRCSSVVSMPLAIDSGQLAPGPAKGTIPGRPPTVRVLFVGTFIPLHGIDVIIKAAILLRHREDLELVLLGDGQLGVTSEALLLNSRLKFMKWHRGWFPLSRVAKEINEADICLGVFGGAEKSARVLPFKVYYALAAGKAVVTQRLMSLPDGVPLPPIANAEGGDPDTLASSLAAAILRLAGDAELRQSLGKAASAYYSTHLSDAAIAVRWRAMLRNLMTQSSS